MCRRGITENAQARPFLQTFTICMTPKQFPETLLCESPLKKVQRNMHAPPLLLPGDRDYSMAHYPVDSDNYHPKQNFILRNSHSNIVPNFFDDVADAGETGHKKYEDQQQDKLRGPRACNTRGDYENFTWTMGTSSALISRGNCGNKVAWENRKLW